MSIFDLHRCWREEYEQFVLSHSLIADARARAHAEQAVREETHLWPEPLLQLSPAYAYGKSITELIEEGVLHPDLRYLFCDRQNQPLRLYRHQEEAIRRAVQGKSFVVVSGTGSGKSFAYLIPIFDYLLKHPEARGSVVALLVYPMNALVNSQLHALEGLKARYEQLTSRACPVQFAKYTGETPLEERQRLQQRPPHLLLTNYMMGELLLTRLDDQKLFAGDKLKFLVFDELHTYRGRQGADVAMLVRRIKARFADSELVHMGASATMAADPDAPSADVRQVVAEFATKFFGHPFEREGIIGEALTPATRGGAPDAAELHAVWSQPLPDDFEALRGHPLARWIEHAFGVERDEAGGYRRRPPRTLSDAAHELTQLTGEPEADCCSRLTDLLEHAERLRQQGAPPLFAFKLHQFISQSRPLYASLEPADKRVFRIEAQIEGEENRLMAPLYFCRECGQDYYRVVCEGAFLRGLPFGASAESDEETPSVIGYLMLAPDETHLPDYPEDWYDTNGTLKREWRERTMKNLWVCADGRLLEQESPEGVRMWFQREPFAYCPSCGVYYTRRESERTKLAGLSNEGRSSATTVTAVALLRHAQRTEAARPKMLSFTDNRQDASLQAGHFNDFVQLSVLRAALVNALQQRDRIPFNEIAQEVVKHMGLRLRDIAKQQGLAEDAAVAPQVWDAFTQLTEYRLYEDLQRNWRYIFPDLEQTGLLEIEYTGLREVCANEAHWGFHEAFAQLEPDQRFEVVRAVLDQFRYNFAINAPILSEERLKSVRRSCETHLNDYWGLDTEVDRLRPSTEMILYGAGARPYDLRGYSLGDRSALGRYLLRTLGLTRDQYRACLEGLLQLLCAQGYLKELEARNGHRRFQLSAGVLVWARVAGQARRHPIYIRGVETQPRVNPFFQRFYQESAQELATLEAREHTAQVVERGERERRERRFRNDDPTERPLPYLVCSPTMELGIDIADLDIVHLRNAPPTPANYAQRSGRAGRQGQPGLILTFCGAYSNHDQYFFHRPVEMAAGIVAPPRIDLTSEALLRAHLHALWLAELRLGLSNTIEHVVDTAQLPELPLREEVQTELAKTATLAPRLKMLFQQITQSLEPYPDWLTEAWIDSAIAEIPRRFDEAFNRWREMFVRVEKQLDEAMLLKRRARSREDQQRAAQIEQEAMRQRNLLLQIDVQYEEGDFYPYRYLASEGFLPGYNFPTLPLRAWVPRKAGEFIARPRVLALREFAPGNTLYHEGSKWEVYQLQAAQGKLEERKQIFKLCDECGAFNPMDCDCCEGCGELLQSGVNSEWARTLEMPNVALRRRERIYASEEERLRKGYKTTLHYRLAAGDETAARQQQADVWHNEAPLIRLHYAPSAHLLHLNHGYYTRMAQGKHGFRLSMQTGEWLADDRDDADAERLKLHVLSTHNLLFVRLLNEQARASETIQRTLLYALLTAITQEFQLEESEVEGALLGRGAHQAILLYETIEGGSGALRRLLTDPRALAQAARRALRVCHYDPDTGADLRPECYRACYRCLLNYTNQSEAHLIDRHAIRELLLNLAQSHTLLRYGERNWYEQLEWLRNRLDRQSELETRFLDTLEQLRGRLPDDAQRRLSLSDNRETVADFFYEPNLCVFIDGAPHDQPEQAARDQSVGEQLRTAGYQVVRLDYRTDLEAQLRRRASLFGVGEVER
jgi:hypothetical protein